MSYIVYKKDWWHNTKPDWEVDKTFRDEESAIEYVESCTLGKDTFFEYKIINN